MEMRSFQHALGDEKWQWNEQNKVMFLDERGRMSLARISSYQKAIPIVRKP